MNTPHDTDPPSRDDATGDADSHTDGDTPKSPGPPPAAPNDDDARSVDSPEDVPTSPGPPPGSVPGNG